MTEDAQNGLSRRQWIAAAPIGAAGAIASASGAAAKDNGTRFEPNPPGDVAPAAWPFPATIASPRLRGYTYLTAMNRDFFTYNEGGREFANGFYSTSTDAQLFCTFDVPAGAIFRDIEVYGSNSTGSDKTVFVGYWRADGGSTVSFLSIKIPSTSSITAVRTEIPESVAGPFPTAVMLVVWFSGTALSFSCNGARLGFTNGGARIGLRAEPTKVFDTTEAGSGGKLAADEIRTISLPASRVPEGCIGAVIRVSVTGASAKGRLKLYGANLPPPEADALAFSNSLDTVGEVTVALPLNRKVSIVATRAVHVQLHVVSTIG